jgi:hypothetical protein
MGNSGYSWNDQISSLYTSTPLLVAEDAQYQGFQAVLAPGFHPLESLERYGFYNDSISSFRVLPDYSLNAYGIGSDEISSFYATIGF